MFVCGGETAGWLYDDLTNRTPHALLFAETADARRVAGEHSDVVVSGRCLVADCLTVTECKCCFACCGGLTAMLNEVV